jgi:hypothetical protein
MYITTDDCIKQYDGNIQYVGCTIRWVYNMLGIISFDSQINGLLLLLFDLDIQFAFATVNG